MLSSLKLVLVPVLIAAWVGFIAGGFVGSSAAKKEGDRRLAAAQRDAADAALKLSSDYRKVEQENAKKLSDALAVRDRALADADALRADAERVQRAAERYRTRMPAAAAAGAAAGDADAERLGRCAELLAESAGLLAEGDRLARRISADKDALAAAAQPRSELVKKAVKP